LTRKSKRSPAQEAPQEESVEAAKAVEADASAEAVAEPEAILEAVEVEVDELEALRIERDEMKDRLMRMAAEFDNFRKRSAREWTEYRTRATSEVLREMIDLVDNFERALEASTEDAEGLQKGVVLIHQQLLSSLKKFGVECVSAEGMEFDPKLHEALMMVESDEVASQHVVQVIQKGYALNGEILRPARVTVSQ
jgi:molecular chaperone GrpE